MSAGVVSIQIAPVKALGLAHPEVVDLDRDGIAGDRMFFVVDAAGRMTNNKKHGPLMSVEPTFDQATSVLTLRFPDGRELSAPTADGEPARAQFYRETLDVRLVPGELSEALSDFAGAHLRIVAHSRPGGGGDRGIAGATSLLSRESLARLAEELGVQSVDARRFRMHFGIAGVDPHAEDAWVGRRVRIGGAVVVPRGLVGRCAVTTQDPDTGRPDLDTLHALTRYRSHVPSDEPLPFGVYAEVVEPGRVALGDPVEPL
ncbi:MAG TPA: MOSC N-terminal beta barrel domain-containing protein [Gaiellaceae bacterium]|nr:MOSC N-terminal beta barrel domain-containing protein [Gaiellaceae bacterium]